MSLYLTQPTAAHKPTLLLTGASGVLGRAMIDELAGDFELVCLRNRKKINDPRVTEFAGSFDHPTLGLDVAEYASLVRRLDGVIHSAAATNWKADPAKIRATNLGGPEVLLRLAAAADAPLYFFSTAFVASPPPTDGRFPGAVTYIQSKIDAEELVRSSSVPTVIVRPSLVTGDSVDGRMSAFQGLHRMMGGIVRGLVPMVPTEPNSLIDAVPQDLVTAVIGKLVREKITGGEYWITAGTGALSSTELVDLCCAVSDRLGIRAFRPRFIPSEAVDRLLLPLMDDVLTDELRAMFTEFLESLWLFQNPAPLPSSVAELGFGQRATREALYAATEKSLLYWAKVKGLLRDDVDLARAA